MQLYARMSLHVTCNAFCLHAYTRMHCTCIKYIHIIHIIYSFAFAYNIFAECALKYESLAVLQYILDLCSTARLVCLRVLLFGCYYYFVVVCFISFFHRGFGFLFIVSIVFIIETAIWTLLIELIFECLIAEYCHLLIF